ncbi:neutral zinc metallopeptidase [Kribbella sp. NPDC000426]|uniref:neutral zinc metallopeptidase n=1 Tax=Kribbella sp. NPDC000426 TaxID=3154255 RepID=UPI00332024DB
MNLPIHLTAAAAALCALALTACTPTSPPTLAAPTPTSTPTPTPTPRPVAVVTTPSDPISIDLADGVIHNKLYTAGKVPTVRCALPRPDLTSKAGMVAYAKMLVACMDKAWAPMVEKSDAYLVPPEVFAYSVRHPKATPECQDPPANSDAFYYWSGMTGKICIEWDEFLNADHPVENLVDFEQLVAHEYGHHVQRSVGILTLYNELMRGKSEAGQLEVMRRKELQASCLGAAFLGANKRTFALSGRRLGIWRSIVQHVGDEYSTVRDHGSRKNHGYWTIRAFSTANPASCNTFTAPAKRVS